MQITTTGIFLGVMLGLIAAPASANDLIFDDGGEHTVDFDVEGDIRILNGSQVTITRDGVAADVELLDGTLLLDGGQVGFLYQGEGSSRFRMEAGEVGALDKRGGSADIVGGLIAAYANASPGLFGSIRVAGDARVAELRVSAASITVAENGFIGGISGPFSSLSGASVTVMGGRVGGIFFRTDAFADIVVKAGSVGSIMLVGDCSCTLAVSGGIVGGIQTRFGGLLEGGVFGPIEGGAFQIVDGTFTGGFVSPLWDDVAYLGASIRGGTFSGPEFALLARGSDYFDLYGGDFVAPLWAIDAGVFNVYGGHYTEPFVGRDDAVFNIYGSHLRYDEGRLTGWLSDGGRIGLQVDLFDRAALRLVSVPEPPSYALFVLTIAALSVCRVQSRHRRGIRAGCDA
jgi:hypothetical protein